MRIDICDRCGRWSKNHGEIVEVKLTPPGPQKISVRDLCCACTDAVAEVMEPLATKLRIYDGKSSFENLPDEMEVGWDKPRKTGLDLDDEDGSERWTGSSAGGET